MPVYHKRWHLQSCFKSVLFLMYHVTAQLVKRKLTFVGKTRKRGRERTLCDTWHFLYNVDHQTKNDVTSCKKEPRAGNKIEYPICVLSGSKTAIFCNRLQILTLFLGELERKESCIQSFHWLKE